MSTPKKNQTFQRFTRKETRTVHLRYDMARIEVQVRDAEILRFLASLYGVGIDDVVRSLIHPALEEASRAEDFVKLGHAIRDFLGLPSLEMTEEAYRAHFGLLPGNEIKHVPELQ